MTEDVGRNAEALVEDLNNRTDEALAALALPHLKAYLPPGLGGQTAYERVSEWIRTGARRALARAGEQGRAALDLLNKEDVRGDLHLTAILAAYLVAVFSKTHLPIEAATALALLLVRHFPRQQ